jgi:hypothetical protein
VSELWRWIDPRVENVRLADLRAYLLAHGWQLKSFPRPEMFLFEEPVAKGKEPVVQLLPASERAHDFRRCVIEIITSLSAVENRHPLEILDEILRHAVDSQLSGLVDERCQEPLRKSEENPGESFAH